MAYASTSKAESLEECMCSICLCILINPVTLPCGHELCMPCFKQNVEEASLTCPLCRTRISTWARKATRTNTLVNQKRWEQIQKLFPERVQKRLDGIDDDDTDEDIRDKEEVAAGYRRMIQLSQPGEIRKEYEEELKRLEAQQEEERKKEEEESALLIEHLRSVEEKRLEDLHKQQQEIAARDAKLAQELGKIINTAETDTPVNRLLQENTAHYPNLLHSPSTPTSSSSHSSSSLTTTKGKQPLVKSTNNKTLETFFRRLPAGAKRSVRSASEPTSSSGSEFKGSPGGAGGVVSPRSQSAPVRGKENQPLVSSADDDDNDNDDDGGVSSFDERLEEAAGCSNTTTRGGSNSSGISKTSSNSRRGGVEEISDVEEEEAEEVVEDVDSTLVDRRFPSDSGGGVGRSSALTVHSDGSESVIECSQDQQQGGESDEEEGEEEGKGEGGAVVATQKTVDNPHLPHFRPIRPTPLTPPKQACAGAGNSSSSHRVPLEPCVVRITPRHLFNTKFLSSTSFPVLPFPQLQVSTNHQSKMAAGGAAGVWAKDLHHHHHHHLHHLLHHHHHHHLHTPTGDQTSGGGGREQKGEEKRSPAKEMGSRICRLLSRDESCNSQAAAAVVGDHPPRIRLSRPRARSTSPMGSPPPHPHSPGHQQQQAKGSLKYCCPSLQELRRRRQLLPDMINEEAMSDSEVGSPSPRYRLRPGRLAMMTRALRGGGGGGGTGGGGRRDRVVGGSDGLESSDRETEEDSDSDGADEELSDSETERKKRVKCDTKSHHAARQAGTVRYTDTVLPWSGDMRSDSDAEVQADPGVGAGAGKGKRLLKKADGGLSYRNCPKSSSKKPSKVEKDDAPHSHSHSRAQHDSDGSEDATTPAVAFIGVRAPHRALRGESHLVQATDPSQAALESTSEQGESLEREDTLPHQTEETSIMDSDTNIGKSDVRQHNRTALDPDSKAHRPQTAKSRRCAKATSPEAAATAEERKAHTRAGRKAMKPGKKAETSRTNQKSIKDWFSPSREAQQQQRPSRSHIKTPHPRGRRGRKATLTSMREEESSVNESDSTSNMTSPASSVSVSPSKRSSQRTRRINPKLDDFLLTVSGRLSQYHHSGKEACSNSDTTTITTPVSSPSKATSLLSTTSTPTPSRKAKRKLPAEYNKSSRGSNPAQQIRFQSESPSRPSPQKKQQLASSTTAVKGKGSGGSSHAQLRGNHPNVSHTTQKQTSSDTHASHTPKKRTSSNPLGAGSDDSGLLHPEEEDEEEGLNQEERDRQLALRLQEQFTLADRLHLKVVRFKGTDDQYSLRRSRSQSGSGHQ